ncbi:MAG: Autoinducer 2-degrading protein LsrG [Verrucomicrobia bacterium ADurb.Bin345]|nr:MAG: Autoinducer 2-degrading protein LsrG [Verrucomicrobia bacterium ADurb.Bin345]
MFVTLVHVRVKPQHVDAFINMTRANHKGSVKEPGNRRFDVLQSPEDPCQFLLYEAFDSEADAKAHKETPHYLAWKEAVADWMAEPRRGVVYHGLLPK